VSRAARRTIRAAVGVAACALVATPASGALAAGPTGDPGAIALYRSAVTATNALPAYVQTQTGYVRIQDSLGPKKFANWAWGWDQFQKGYHPAAEHLVIAQRHGRTLWIVDTMTSAAKGCHSPSCREAIPIMLVITRTHAYYGLISSGSLPTCFNPRPLAHVPYSVGTPWWVTAGKFSKPVPDGALTEVTSRFTVGGQAVTEADWITNASHLFTRSSLHLAAGDGHPAFAYRNADTRLTTAPHFPKLQLCS
jgi:hypothetical protein